MRALTLSAFAIGLLLSGCFYNNQRCCDANGNCYDTQGDGNCPGSYGYNLNNSGYSGGPPGTRVECCSADGTCVDADRNGNCPKNMSSGHSGATSGYGTSGGTSTSATSSSGGSSSGGQSTGSSSSGGTTGTTSGSTGGSTGGTSGTSSGGGTGGDAGSSPLIGAPCTCDAECGPGRFCFPSLNYSSDPAAGTDWAGGYCTSYNCDLRNPCPSDAICYTLPQGSASLYSLCLATCSSNACERSGYTCGEIGDPVAACLPECVHDCDCSSGLVCESGSCQQPCYVDGQCGPNEVCNANHCQAGPPLACCDLPGMDPCPSGMECQSGMCVITCTFDVQCPAGERCQCNGQCG